MFERPERRKTHVRINQIREDGAPQNKSKAKSKAWPNRAGRASVRAIMRGIVDADDILERSETRRNLGSRRSREMLIPETPKRVSDLDLMRQLDSYALGQAS